MEDLEKKKVELFLKNLSKYLAGTISNFKELSGPHTFEIDLTDTYNTLKEIFKKVLRDFVSSNILNTKSGYIQPDNTYAIFRYKFKQLQEIANENLTHDEELRLHFYIISIIYYFLSLIENNKFLNFKFKGGEND